MIWNSQPHMCWYLAMAFSMWLHQCASPFPSCPFPQSFSSITVLPAISAAGIGWKLLCDGVVFIQEAASRQRQKCTPVQVTALKLCLSPFFQPCWNVPMWLYKERESKTRQIRRGGGSKWRGAACSLGPFWNWSLALPFPPSLGGGEIAR